jgi:hypothetical protein
LTKETIKTPDERYLVIKGRLWRCSDPSLPESVYQEQVKRLMAARRMVRDAKASGDESQERDARQQVDHAKRALGERGPVWWSDDEPDYTQCKIENTPYAEWYRSLQEASE